MDVYRIPQQAFGHRGNEWGPKVVWSGKLVIVQQGQKCTVRLLDKNTSKEFAQAPITEGAVARTMDSNRKFALRCMNRNTGQKAFVGIAFGGGNNDALNFTVALQDFANYNKKKRARREKQAKGGDAEAADNGASWAGLGKSNVPDDDDDEDEEEDEKGAAAPGSPESPKKKKSSPTGKKSSSSPLGGGGRDDDDEDDEDRPRMAGMGGGRDEDDEDEEFDADDHQDFINTDHVQKEVKLMRVRGQRHGASLPRGHEEV